jgi:hypothetical protein
MNAVENYLRVKYKIPEDVPLDDVYVLLEQIQTQDHHGGTPFFVQDPSPEHPSLLNQLKVGGRKARGEN